METVSLLTTPQPEYELLDSGGEEKLERYGDIVLARPDPQALWQKTLSAAQWTAADASYTRAKGQGSGPAGRQGDWDMKRTLPKEWHIAFGGLVFHIRATSFKHTGLFPEQLSNWDWVASLLRKKIESGQGSGEVPSILNLFGYTGGATLAAAQAGAQVTHVDASKTAVAWARENAALSGLADKPIRWMVEDVMRFVSREIRRGSKYDGIIMDPPAFGHGPKDELWKIEEDFIALVERCSQLLSEKPLFFLISGYAAGYSPLAFAYNLEPILKRYGGSVSCGDLGIEDRNGRVLPCGIFGRWSA
jgi:23S rRNA (cytosine1962-C5)-methyltransferase